MCGVIRVIAVKCEVPVADLNTRGRVGGLQNEVEIVWIIIIIIAHEAPAVDTGT